MPSLGQFIGYVNKSAYKLDSIAVVGLFGGDRASNALETIHLYAGRRWAGWYNYPGSMAVAMKFGQIASSRTWETIFPGPNRSPIDIFIGNLDGKSGPDCHDVSSGTSFRTGYLGHLTAEMCKEYDHDWEDILQIQLPDSERDGSKARETSMPKVTILTLSGNQWAQRSSAVYAGFVEPPPAFIPIAPISNSGAHLALWSIVPSFVSTLACVFCFLGHDILCASLILLGILASAFSSFVLGSATLGIRTQSSRSRAESGDGLINLADGSIIILKGSARDVDAVTKGKFELKYATWVLNNGTYSMIGISSIVLWLQLFAQLLFLPRCTLFGQILALGSFAASSMYHFYVSWKSAGRERLRLEALSGTRNLKERMKTWCIGTKTQRAVFTCLVLGEGNPEPLRHVDFGTVLMRMRPSEMPVWRYWREKVIRELGDFWANDLESSSYVPHIRPEPEDQWERHIYTRFTTQDKELLNTVIDDALAVFRGYLDWRHGEAAVWQGKQMTENYVPGLERFVSLSVSEIDVVNTLVHREPHRGRHPSYTTRGMVRVPGRLR